MEGSFVSAGGLHALAYCERLYYLENVERIRLADERVFAGRRAHEEHLPEEEGTLSRIRFESVRLGLCGEADLLRRIDGSIVPYELKRGRSAGCPGNREAWHTDRIQLGAYALLAEEHFGQGIKEGRVRYLADKCTIRVPIDEALRKEVIASIERAKQLASETRRPPVTNEESRCTRCSLAPACLPEEARLSADPKWRTIRLLPIHPKGLSLHIIDTAARLGRSGDALRVARRDGSTETVPIAEVGSVVLHGHAQITTQALRLCAVREVPVHWVTASGGLVGSFAPIDTTAQRHLRQFEALSDARTRLKLSRALVHCKVESQLRYLLRATRGGRSPSVAQAVAAIRTELRQLDKTTDLDVLRGREGAAASAYFGAIPELISDAVPALLRPQTRTRRPAKDRFSALLNYAYGAVYREVLSAIIAVGLHPGFGFFHRPRTAAHTLALDIMELFRVCLADMPVIAALNRRTFDEHSDFEVSATSISLSDSGRLKLIDALERRRHESWHHNVVGYSLSYARIIELEVRLLEKEWSNEPGLFGRLRIR